MLSDSDSGLTLLIVVMYLRYFMSFWALRQPQMGKCFVMLWLRGHCSTKKNGYMRIILLGEVEQTSSLSPPALFFTVFFFFLHIFMLMWHINGDATFTKTA